MLPGTFVGVGKVLLGHVSTLDVCDANVAVDMNA